MKQLRFEGHGDDTFTERTMRKTYHDSAFGTPMVFKVSDGDRGLFVWGQYSGTDWPEHMPACWVIGVQQIEENEALPPWPMRFETGESGYTPSLVIEAPDDVQVEYWNDQDGDG